MILTIRTDKPEAEIGLYENGKKITYKTWEAHRQLSSTIHRVINDLLTGQKKTTGDITGIVFYEGPGSFTGLRIGAAVANALSAGDSIPLAQAGGETWITDGLDLLESGTQAVASPVYGQSILTTKPRK